MLAGIYFLGVIVIAHCDVRPDNPVIELYAINIVFVDGFQRQIEQQLARLWMQRVKPHKSVRCNFAALDIAAQPSRFLAAQMVHGVFVGGHKAILKPRDIKQATAVRLNQCFLQ